MITYANVKQLAGNCAVYSDAPVPDRRGRYRRLTTPVRFELGNGDTLTILPGFEWDEASVPWIFQPLYPKSGIYAISALVHDALYYYTGYSRLWVEEEFLRWMLATGVSRRQAIWRWAAVNALGWSWYVKNRHWPSERCVRNRGMMTIEHKKSDQ